MRVQRGRGRPAYTERTTLGQNILAARRKAGLSQKELGERIGVAQQVVASWERKTDAISSLTLTRLAKELNVSTDELLGLNQSEDGAKKIPGGKIRDLFEAISELPRRQQAKITEVIEALLAQQQS